MDTVVISDTTLRDGEQAPGVAFNRKEKLQIASMLDSIGISEIEAGTPVIGEGEQDCIREILSLGLNAKISTWNRAHIKDVKASLACGARRISIAAPVSDLHILDILKKDRNWVLQRTEEVLDFAKGQGLEVCVGAVDASRGDERFLLNFAALVQKWGGDRLRFDDTVGILDPLNTYEYIKKLRAEIDINIEVHCHNDLGMATANTLAALKAGAKYASVTVNGLGERAGNAALEEVILALKYAEGIDLGIDTRKLPVLSELVAQVSRRPLSPSKPIVGKAVFAHESGVHVDGVIKNPETFEPFPPEEVGQQRTFVLGKHSGSSSIRHRLSGQDWLMTEDEIRKRLLRV